MRGYKRLIAVAKLANDNVAVAKFALKLAALPFSGHKDVYDTARWRGADWTHPPPGDESHNHHVASWATPAYPWARA